MTRLASFVLTAGVSLLALTTAACAESAVQSEAQADTDAPAASTAMPSPLDAAINNAPDAAWRTVDPEDLLRITTSEGVIWVELADEFAPRHTARMRELARADWFDFKVWHRVIDGFMAQGGGALDNPNVRPDTLPIAAEFTIRRDPNALLVTEIQDRVINPRSNRSRAQAGYWNGFPAGTQPAALAGIVADGRVDSWLLHCDGAAAMARTADPNSANAQFYIVRGEAEHLNAEYTVWGKVRLGHDVTYQLYEGTVGETFGFMPSLIEDMSVASDLPEDEQLQIQVMDTGSQAFIAYLDAYNQAQGDVPDICEIDVPVRVLD